jgi:hypothetical protein
MNRIKGIIIFFCSAKKSGEITITIGKYINKRKRGNNFKGC